MKPRDCFFLQLNLTIKRQKDPAGALLKSLKVSKDSEKQQGPGLTVDPSSFHSLPRSGESSSHRHADGANRRRRLPEAWRGSLVGRSWWELCVTRWKTGGRAAALKAPVTAFPDHTLAHAAVGSVIGGFFFFFRPLWSSKCKLTNREKSLLGRQVSGKSLL